MTKMKQCKLSNKDSIMYSWIEERGAKVGASVELKNFDADRKFWKVEEVFEPALDEATIKKKQELDRKSLSSIITD